MKAMMGFLFFMLFLGGLAFVALQGRQLATQKVAGGAVVVNGVAEIAGINWRPALIGTEALSAESGMFVRFEADGSIKGHGGCNAFFGSLVESESGIKTGPLGATRMACEEFVMDREMEFMRALEKARRFEMSVGRLTLIDESDTLLAELVPASK